MAHEPITEGGNKMKKGIIAKKIGMTQIFDENGKVIPVTVVEAGPCPVVQKKTVETDGYDSIQIGYGDVSNKHVTKPLQGHFSKMDIAPKRHLKEFILDNETMAALNIGDLIKADAFAVGDVVSVSGTSKGKGFQGVIKRHNFSRLKETHGTHKKQRHTGSIGSGTTPGKVAKGKKMPGQTGNEAVTIKNLEVVKVDAENNLIALKGAVPGPKNGIVYIALSARD